MIKILSFNMGNYDPRQISFLLSLVSSYNPDLICLQSVVNNHSKKINVPEILSQKLAGYMHSHYFPTFKQNHNYGNGMVSQDDADEGLFVMSKKPIKVSTLMYTIPLGYNRHPQGLQRITRSGYHINHVHLSKYPTSRAQQRKYIPQANIVVGHFNAQAYEIPKFCGVYYKNSYTFKPYESFPLKDMTLDYCLIHRSKFVGVACIDTDCSYHCAMVYAIDN